MESTLGKLKRAAEHIGELGRLCAQTTQSCRTIIEQVPASSKTLVIAETCTADPRISSVFGDAAHNIRAALDHLVCAFTRVRGGECGYPAAFPIEPHSPWLLEDEVARRKAINRFNSQVASVPRKALAALKRLQPFSDIGFQPDRNPLCWLKYLDDRDKHQRLSVAVTSVIDSRLHVEGHPLDWSRVYDFSNGPVRAPEGRAVALELPLVVKVRGELRFEVALDEEGRFRGIPVVSLANHMLWVARYIIEDMIWSLRDFHDAPSCPCPIRDPLRTLGGVLPWSRERFRAAEE